MAVLLLPPWLAISSAGVAMLIDQCLGRTGPRRTTFNVASLMLTTDCIISDIKEKEKKGGGGGHGHPGMGGGMGGMGMGGMGGMM